MLLFSLKEGVFCSLVLVLYVGGLENMTPLMYYTGSCFEFPILALTEVNVFAFFKHVIVTFISRVKCSQVVIAFINSLF